MFLLGMAAGFGLAIVLLACLIGLIVAVCRSLPEPHEYVRWPRCR
jgi:hypothetical protein